MARVRRITVSPILVSSLIKRSDFVIYASFFSLFFYIVFNIKLVKCHITRTVPPLDIIITEDIFDWLGQSLHFIFEERLLIGPRCMKGFVGAHSLLKSNHFLSVLFFT